MNNSFGATSTTDEVLQGIDLRGKRVLVTGVSAGLGVETARALAAHGAEVIGAARDPSKAQAATEQVRAQAANGGSLQLVQNSTWRRCATVRRCADSLLAARQGLSTSSLPTRGVAWHAPKAPQPMALRTQFSATVTSDISFWVNPHRFAAAAGFAIGEPVFRRAYRYADVDLEDPNFEHTPYAEFTAYGRSKTANASPVAVRGSTAVTKAAGCMSDGGCTRRHPVPSSAGT